MNRKLTLSLDEKIIARAKAYARVNNESLSCMVEKYFEYVTESAAVGPTEDAIPADLEDLVGMIAVPDTMDVKEEYRRHRGAKSIRD